MHKVVSWQGHAALAACLLAFYVGYTVSPEEAGMAFYAAATTLIPLILITLAIQGQLFGAVGEGLRTPEAWKEVMRSRDRMHRKFLPDGAADHWGVKAVHALGTMMLFAVITYRSVIAFLALASLVAAEFVALHPLAADRATDGNPRVVYAALAGGFVAVAMLAAGGWLRSVEPS